MLKDVERRRRRAPAPAAIATLRQGQGVQSKLLAKYQLKRLVSGEELDPPRQAIYSRRRKTKARLERRWQLTGNHGPFAAIT
jgi:hypothetical protein